MLHDISPSYDYINDDYVQYADYLKLYCTSQRHPFFISDWNSDKTVLHLNSLTKYAYNNALSHIDTYYSAGDNFCQEKIVDILFEKYNIHIQKNQITIGNNATSLICFCVTNLISQGISNFLAVTPVYFSAIDAIQVGHGRIAFIQPSLPNLSIDLDAFEHKIKHLNIQAVIITDPYFGFGKKIRKDIFNQLVAICSNYDCTIICDFARYGLDWTADEEHLIFNEELLLLQHARKYAAIYSPCKSLYANGIKTAIMITSQNIGNVTDNFTDSMLGSISAAQISFLDLLLDNQNQEQIVSCIKENVTKAQANYDKINSYILGTKIISYQPDMGNYMVLGIPKKENDYKMFQNILSHCNINTLPLSLYHFYDNSMYFFRVNLSLESVKLINSVMALEKFIIDVQ
ncbi:MAG: hypothetical protein J6J36_02220 [Clostridia bacterium]|nr:hypothetical protein [Clostridia bacterium]MBP3707409.1 hypothetical protein [Clostridia bacterium]